MNNNIRRRNARLDKPAAWHCWLSGLLFSLSFNTAALGEESAERESVLTRARPELSPLGVQVGGFRAYPAFTYKGMHDDNIFATQNDKESSLISEYSLEMSLRSNWPNHQLNLLARTDIGRHSDFASENYEDWEFSANGRLDISHNSQFSGGGSIKRDHVDRTAPDDANGSVPTEFDETSVFGRFAHRMQRFQIELDASLKKKDYDDVPGIVNGVNVIINQDDRDRTEHGVGLRGSYEILSERDQVFVALRSDRREYDELQDVINADRSSKGYEAVMGLALELSGVTSASISAGQRVQNYEYPFADIRAPVYGATLNWNVTALTSINVDLQRSIMETTSIFFSGYVSTNTHVTLDHELRRNLLLNLGLNYITDDYQSIGAAERDDTTYDAVVGATYMTNRYFYVSMHYHYLQRESSNNISPSDTSDEFEKNIVFIQMQTQF